MAYDFKKAEAQSLARDKPLTLAAIGLGPSSGGKSGLAGTMGVKTLYLSSQGEEHGPSSAKLMGGNLVIDVPYDMEYDEKTGKLKALGFDGTVKSLVNILSDVEGIKAAGFKGVVVDGFTELEQIIRGTAQFKTDCLSKEGNHNGFQEPAATLRQFRLVLDCLRKLRREGIHYYVTCILDVKAQGEEGEITDSEPQLLGYKLPSLLLPQFPDQLVVGRMQSPDGKDIPRIQFNASVSKTSVDAKTKELKKYTCFCPRLEGVPSDKLPEHMKADLSEVIKLKLKGGKS